MRKTILIAAATLALGLAGQAQASWSNGISLNGIKENGITTHGMGVSTTIQGITLPGMQGVVVND